MTANFEAEKFELEQKVKKLDNSLKEKEIELDNSKQSIENQQNLYEKLKDQFKEYILRTRPELTPGQIGNIKFIIPYNTAVFRFHVRVLKNG